MLQILNSKERNQAFLKFLLFFVITVLLVVFAIFFDFKMPLRENKMLYSEISTQRLQDFNQQTFLQNLEEAVDLLDSLDKPSARVTQIDARLSDVLNGMQDMEAGFSTVNRKINKIIIQRLGELHQKKIDIRKLKVAEETLSAVRIQLGDCQALVKTLRENSPIE